MTKTDVRTLEAIMGLRGNAHWGRILDWIRESFQFEQQQLLMATNQVDMFRVQGRAGQLKEMLDRTSPDARGVPGSG